MTSLDENFQAGELIQRQSSSEEPNDTTLPDRCDGNTAGRILP